VNLEPILSQLAKIANKGWEWCPPIVFVVLGCDARATPAAAQWPK